MATIRPLYLAGAISAIYIGESIEAIPTPMPAINREAIKKSLLGAKAINKEEIPKIEAAIRSPGFLPFLSAIFPAVMQPIIAPNAKLPVAKPSQYSVRLNFSFKKGNAPEITAKSNPNRYPPKAEINDKTRM